MIAGLCPDEDARAQCEQVIARVHGFAFVAFLMASLNLGSKARWSAGTWIATALSGVVPFMSFIIEGKRRNEVKEKFQLS